MSPQDHATDVHPPRESEEERRSRIEREARMLAAARADIEAGRGIPWPEVKAWLIGNERAPDGS